MSKTSSKSNADPVVAKTDYTAGKNGVLALPNNIKMSEQYKNLQKLGDFYYPDKLYRNIKNLFPTLNINPEDENYVEYVNTIMNGCADIYWQLPILSGNKTHGLNSKQGKRQPLQVFIYYLNQAMLSQELIRSESEDYFFIQLLDNLKVIEKYYQTDYEPKIPIKDYPGVEYHTNSKGEDILCYQHQQQIWNIFTTGYWEFIKDVTPPQKNAYLPSDSPLRSDYKKPSSYDDYEVVKIDKKRKDSPQDDDENSREKEYLAMTIPQLKSLLKERALPVSGNKDELVVKLLAYDHPELIPSDSESEEEESEHSSKKSKLIVINSDNEEEEERGRSRKPKTTTKKNGKQELIVNPSDAQSTVTMDTQPSFDFNKIQTPSSSKTNSPKNKSSPQLVEKSKIILVESINGNQFSTFLEKLKEKSSSIKKSDNGYQLKIFCTHGPESKKVIGPIMKTCKTFQEIPWLFFDGYFQSLKPNIEYTANAELSSL
jgi:hypothetical protein